MSSWMYLGVFTAGWLSGFIGSIAGSGGMISLPALLLLGLSPQSAIATNTVGDIGAFSSAVFTYHRSRKVNWKVSLIVSLITVPATVIGAYVVVTTESKILIRWICCFLLLLLPISLSNRHIGIQQSCPGVGRMLLGSVLFFVFVVNATVVPAGGTTITGLIVVYFFGLQFVDAFATTMFPGLVRSLLATCFFAFHGHVRISYALLLFLGALLGARFGARSAVEKGNAWVKFVLIAVVILSAIQILV